MILDYCTCFWMLLALLLSGVTSDVVLSPTKTGSDHAAFIFFQGAEVPADRYTPLFKLIQAAAPMPLWIGSPDFPLNTPIPPLAGNYVNSILQKLHSAGMPANTTLFFGGHSLGTTIVQGYVANATLPISGLILLAGYLVRSHNYPSFSFPIPTLTVAGELDGLARITRTGAEAYYHQIQINKDPTASKRYPVVMIHGMNHWQFASGTPTSFVNLRDLKAEINIDDAHKQAAALVADYMAMITNSSSSAGTLIANTLKTTQAFLAPIIDAYNLEGSIHLNAPNQFGGPGQSTCVKGGCSDGSKWVPVAQTLIAGDTGKVKLNVTNNYVQVSSTPITGEEFHLPNVTFDPKTLVAFIPTYAQGSWNVLDKTDTAFAFTSASELAAKLMSRQCTQIAITGQDVPFSVDDPDFCMMANEQAYEWALDHAGETTRTRFQNYGQKYVFAADEAKSGGPFFIDSPLSFKTETINGTSVVVIAAPMQKTEKDYWKDHFPFPRPSWIPDPGCFHYCKLLSPARAMEWIYVDGLRAAMSNSSACVECTDASRVFCWVDGKCYDPKSPENPCSPANCVAANSIDNCACQSCSDATCAANHATIINSNTRRSVKQSLIPDQDQD